MTEDLYRAVVLEHYKNPANRHPMDDVTGRGYSHNPLCGDEITIYARVEDGRLADASFDARGCSISQASADMMIDHLRGRGIAEVEATISDFEKLLEDSDAEPPASLAGVAVLAAVRKFPVRVKCALLPWRTLREAIA